MKRNILILLALAETLLTRAQITIYHPIDYEPGLPVDTVQYAVGYDFAFVKDAAKKPYKPLREQMTLEIGGRTAHFFSQVAFQCDSIAADKMKKGDRQVKNTSQIAWQVYTDYPSTGQYSYLEKLGTDRFVMAEQAPAPAWTLCTDSVKTILGYRCQKAATAILGREWAAWYTEDVPLDYGPGLILQAESADSCFSFEANGLTKGRPSHPLYYKGEKFESLDRKTLKSVYSRYYADTIGCITNNPNVKVIMKDSKGNVTNGRMKWAYDLPDKTLCE